MTTATVARRVAVVRSILRYARRPPRPGPDAPLVSVVIPTYDRSAVLRHAITSVLWQTHAKLELHVVGDACTDDSEEVVRSFGDPRVHWHNREENSGSQGAPSQAGFELGLPLHGNTQHAQREHLARLAGQVPSVALVGRDERVEPAPPLGERGSQVASEQGMFSGQLRMCDEVRGVLVAPAALVVPVRIAAGSGDGLRGPSPEVVSSHPDSMVVNGAPRRARACSSHVDRPSMRRPCVCQSSSPHWCSCCPRRARMPRR
ncbi:MAG TPA: glycosyltransferase [Solirubrobacteraceae bacterium]|nr:glycosyltransferase [Solirubrobacteraceae bacterium]